MFFFHVKQEVIAACPVQLLLWLLFDALLANLVAASAVVAVWRGAWHHAQIWLDQDLLEVWQLLNLFNNLLNG